jgi:hypothetical protein
MMMLAAAKTADSRAEERGVAMPWFPDFVSAVELARQQTRAAGRADPVAQYFAALNKGDARLLEDAWPGEVVVYDPGGIGLQPCAVTDDGVRCALEYNCVRWGRHDLPPQAGLGVYERGPDGLLAAARVYDDIDPPAGDT